MINLAHETNCGPSPKRTKETILALEIGIDIDLLITFFSAIMQHYLFISNTFNFRCI